MIESSAPRANPLGGIHPDGSFLDQFPRIDWASLDRRTSGYGDLLQRVLNLARRQFDSCVSDILLSLSQHRPDSERFIHTLKGICLNIEARRASVLLAEMEKLARDGRFPDAFDRTPMLVSEISGLESELESHSGQDCPDKVPERP